jgi:hypothetical protein
VSRFIPHPKWQRARHFLVNWWHKQTHYATGPADPDLHRRVGGLLKFEPDAKDEAAYLALEREVRGVKAAPNTSVGDPPPPLTGLEEEVLDEIRGHPQGIKGPRIIANLARRRITLGQGSLTGRIIPKLKKWYGVRNRRPVGYYIPATQH